MIRNRMIGALLLSCFFLVQESANARIFGGLFGRRRMRMESRGIVVPRQVPIIQNERGFSTGQTPFINSNENSAGNLASEDQSEVPAVPLIEETQSTVLSTASVVSPATQNPAISPADRQAFVTQDTFTNIPSTPPPRVTRVGDNFFQNNQPLNISREGRILLTRQTPSGQNGFFLADPRTEMAIFNHLRGNQHPNLSVIQNFYSQTFGAQHRQFQLSPAGTGTNPLGSNGSSHSPTPSSRPVAPVAPRISPSPSPTIFSRWREEFLDNSRTHASTREEINSVTNNIIIGRDWKFTVFSQSCVSKNDPNEKHRMTLILFNGPNGENKIAFLTGERSSSPDVISAWNNAGPLRGELSDPSSLYHTFPTNITPEFPEGQIHLRTLPKPGGEHDFVVRYVFKHSSSLPNNRFGMPQERDGVYYCKSNSTTTARPLPSPSPSL